MTNKLVFIVEPLSHTSFSLFDRFTRHCSDKAYACGNIGFLAKSSEGVDNKFINKAP